MHKPSSLRHLSLPFALAVLVSLSACGKKDDAVNAPAPAPAASIPAPAPAPAAPDPSAPPAAATSVTPPASGAAGTTSSSSGSATTTADAGAAAGASGGGQAVYSQTCVACHAAGVAGAPKIGDKADWDPRIAQGKDTLYTHAINGFQGKKGVMPPKGGNVQLADADVKSAVDYMVSQAAGK